MLELKFCQTIQTTIIFPIFHFIQPLANLHLWMYSPLGKYSPLNLFTSWQLYTFEFIHFLANIHLWIYSPLGRYTHLNLFTPWEIYTFATSVQDSPEHSKAFRKLFNYIDGQNSQGLKNTHDNSSHGKDIFKWFRKQFYNVLLHPIQSTKQSSFTKGLNGLHWRASSE